MVVDADLGVGLVVELAADVNLEAHPSDPAGPPRQLCSRPAAGENSLDPSLGEPDDPVGLLGDLEVVSHHDDSQPSFAVQVAEQLQNGLTRVGSRGCRSAHRRATPTARP